MNGAWHWTAMNGELFIQKNFLGTYTIKGDKNVIHPIMSYLETGQVHTPVFSVQNSKTFKLLKKQACHFRLEKLLQHIQDVEYILNTCSQHESLHALLYCVNSKTYVLYSNRVRTFGSTETFLSFIQ